MRNRWMWCLVGALCVISVLVGGVVPPDDVGGGGAMVEMSACINKPAEHEELAKSVGTWNVAMKWWMAPDAEPMTSNGTTVMSLAMNGHFLKQEFTGDWMGNVFHGLGFIGYDTIDKEFVSIWMEDVHPILWVGRGKQKDGVITYEGTHPNHMTGEQEMGVFTFQHVGPDKMTITMYRLTEDVSREKQGELLYTRKK